MTLIFFVDPSDGAMAKFWRDTETGETGWNATLAQLSGRVADDPKRPVCLALAGDGVMTRTLRLPMKRQRDLDRAAGLAIDDALAAPISNRVLAMGPDEDGLRQVCALSQTELETALEAAQTASIDPDIVTVDHALLPTMDDGQAAVFDLGRRYAVRTAEGAFTAEQGFAEVLLTLQSELQRFAVDQVQITAEGVPNFRTGAFTKRKPLPNLRPFLLAASLAFVAGAVFLTGSFVEGWRYGGAADRLQVQAEANYSRAFPGQPIVDLERQLSGRHQSGGIVSDFLPLTAILADVIDDQDSTSLSSLSYTDDGELVAELLFGSIPDLEQVTTTLTDRGVFVREGSDTRREDGLLVSRLFLRAR